MDNAASRALLKKKVLVVDDDDTVIDFIVQFLEAEGFETLTASNGKAAVDLVKAQSPDLVLTDVEMPVMSGLEAIKIIRSSEKTRLIPIILITALKKTEDRIKGIEAGCDDFITKPFDNNELRARVRSLLIRSYYRQLLDEKEKFEYVLNHMDSGIVVLNEALKISQINEKARELLAVGPGEGPADFFDHLRQHYKVGYPGDLASDIRSRALTFELERPETDRFKALILSAVSSTVVNPAGNINSIVMIVQDVTAQRAQEKLKLTFLDFASHKLRTPLTPIDGYLLLIGNGSLGPLTDKMKQSLDICVTQFNLLKDTVGDVIEASRVLREDGRADEKVLLSDAIPKLIESVIGQNKDKKIQYETMGLDKGLQLRMGNAHFDFILRNLVKNAVEHNDQENVVIKVSAGKADGKIAISVSDNGRGIPPEERAKIFEPFYQIDRWNTGSLKGFGLGLAVVKHLMNRHGGEIRIDSKLEQGSTFTLTFGSERSA